MVAVVRAGAVYLLRFTDLSEIAAKEKCIINLYYSTSGMWLRQLQRMGKNKLPKQALQDEPKGRRNIGRPRKRWKDQLDLEG